MSFVDHSPRKKREVSGTDQAPRAPRVDSASALNVKYAARRARLSFLRFAVHTRRRSPARTRRGPRNLLRPVSKIAVHDDHDLAAHGLERGRQRGLVPERPGQPHPDDAAVSLGRVPNELEGPDPRCRRPPARSGEGRRLARRREPRRPASSARRTRAPHRAAGWQRSPDGVHARARALPISSRVRAWPAGSDQSVTAAGRIWDA